MNENKQEKNMIIFSGQLTGKSQTARTTHRLKKSFVMYAIGLGFLLLAAILSSFSDAFKNYNGFFWGMFGGISVLVIFITVMCYKKQTNEIPQNPLFFYNGKIYISDLGNSANQENIQLATANPDESIKKYCYPDGIIDFSSVKAVYEHNDYYYVKVPKCKYQIICQKDLIIQGTLEEFEEMFSDKIVKK